MLLYLLKVPKAITFNITSQIQGNNIKCLVDNHKTSFMVKQFNACNHQYGKATAALLLLV